MSGRDCTRVAREDPSRRSSHATPTNDSPGTRNNHLDDRFPFLRDPAVDAINWRAEHAIRPAIVTRKEWGGNRIWAGAEVQSI
jgi:hypothetical protein